MKKLKNMLSSPGRIAIFAVCVVIILALLAFAGLKVGASVLNNQGIGLEKATKIAIQNAGYQESDATLIRGHFDRDDGLSVYEIEFRAGKYDYEYVVSSKDGTIIDVDMELAPGIGTEPSENIDPDLSGQGGSPASPESGYIGVDRAKDVALQDAGTDASLTTFTKAKLEKDDGIYLYDVEFVSGDFEYSYEIAATDGRIIDKDVDSIYD